jgi:hypothetical protein
MYKLIQNVVLWQILLLKQHLSLPCEHKSVMIEGPQEQKVMIDYHHDE